MGAGGQSTRIFPADRPPGTHRPRRSCCLRRPLPEPWLPGPLRTICLAAGPDNCPSCLSWDVPCSLKTSPLVWRLLGPEAT